MHHFTYRDGALHAEGVNLVDLAAHVGTPFYCYSTATLERHYRVFADAFGGRDTLICYSIKANSNLSVIKTLAQQGAGMDVVSEGELRRALAAGVPPSRIVFSGVGKTRDEMAHALQAGIYGFNVESEAEARALSAVAQEQGRTARIAFRINPDVDARTHAKISTGKAEDKFGVPWNDAAALYALAADLPGLEPCGVHMHIGSQITDLEPFERAFKLLSDLVGDLRTAGHTIDFVNLGGGLGVPYRGTDDIPPHPDDYARVVERAAGALDCRLLFEPGRMIAGNAGILVFRVLYLKHGDQKRFTIVDAGMNDLIRPTLYDAHHDIWAVDEARGQEPALVQDIVGPVCETGDFLARDRALPPFREGDLGAVMTAGAYGAVQASSYNSRLLVPEVIVRGDEYAIARARPSYEDMLAAEHIAPWLTPRKAMGRA
ncbi:diaminopimelate decarboxylase [Dichotomicrobium thermohalophilum]|uniref:Diaminopimelate decarboxylase n=1 Tax=Dichotomicrobium thermohalophilum TaxID=933063 RepID=A0A397Q5U1_9HYPH|nr:diaminopimelate decarboxylase [Dichotomicrobium thermohalophilum]RIA56323.1 diaminopimelate decarboxylase [Dichotomicrobium thermohalophilum]